MNYHTIKIENASENETIYSFLKTKGYSENFLNNLRKEKTNIFLNKKQRFITFKVKDNDKLLLNTNPTQKTDVSPCDFPLEILYEDNFLLVVKKPANLCTMPNKSHYKNNLVGAILNYYNKRNKNVVVRILNRLDMEVCGIIVVCLTSIFYKEMFESLKKTYHAIICGKLTKDLLIDKNIQTITNKHINERKRIISQNGKKAITKVCPLKIFDKHTLVLIELKHGRTHQIRLHLKSANHAILGDKLYGEKSDIMPYTALICKKVELIHPKTKQKMQFEIDYDKDFKSALLKL